MASIRRFAAFAVLLAGLGAEALLATAQARVYGTVTDEKGQPVAGVKVIVTLADNASFRLEETSNAKGAFAVTLIDATRTYSYRWEKEGYQTLEQTFKVPISQNERHDVQILSLEEAVRRGATGAAPAAADAAVEAFNLGAEAAHQGDTVTARAKFEEAASLDPTLAAPWTALASLDYTDSEWAAAAEHAAKAHTLDPGDPKPLRILVGSYEQLGDTANARLYSDKLVALDPTAGAEGLYTQGVELYNGGDTDGALALFEQAVAASAEHAKAHYMLGICLVASDAARAREHLETFLRLAPDDPDAGTAREMLQYLK